MAQVSAEKRDQAGPTQKERVASVPQSEQLEKNATAALLERKKEQSRQSTSPVREVGESQGE